MVLNVYYSVKTVKSLYAAEVLKKKEINTRLVDAISKSDIPDDDEQVCQIDTISKKNIMSLVSDARYLYNHSLTGLSSLKHAIFTKPVAQIGNCCFKNCYKLEEVAINITELEYIGKYAFENCASLKSLGTGQESLNPTPTNCYTERHINLEMTLGGVDTIITPRKSTIDFSKADKLNEIEDFAFINCSNIKAIILPDKSITFGKGIFKGCSKLKFIFCNNEKVRLYIESQREFLNLSSKCKILDCTEKSLKKIRPYTLSSLIFDYIFYLVLWVCFSSLCKQVLKNHQVISNVALKLFKTPKNFTIRRVILCISFGVFMFHQFAKEIVKKFIKKNKIKKIRIENQKQPKTVPISKQSMRKKIAEAAEIRLSMLESKKSKPPLST